MKPLILSLLAVGLLEAPPGQPLMSAQVHQADIIVYGGTSSGVVAAVQATRMGKSVILVCPDRHLGGMTSGGLGWTDSGHTEVIGGLAREFYHRVWIYYQRPEAWKWQRRSAFKNRGQGSQAIDDATQTMWTFEPHVAEHIFDQWIADHKIPVFMDRWLDRQRGVRKENGRIKSITMLDGTVFRGGVFIDATYEGDLMAAAGVPYHVGRESNEEYGETWNGVQVGVLHHRHNFGKNRLKIDPYRSPGDPASGLLAGISGDPPGEKGSADHRIQAYCFRMCLSNHPDNRVPFPKPAGYDPGRYELLARILAAGWNDVFHKFDSLPNRKTDTNNDGPFSTDDIGMNYDYPEASYSRRGEIIEEHEHYQKGLMYFLAHDPRSPAAVRKRMSQWGLAKDEFTDHGHWPHQIYVREARRMMGAFIMTEHEVLGRREVPESVGMGSYTMDSHNVQRYVKPDGTVENEGDIGVPPPRPYSIAYGALTPEKARCLNLLVPVALSASHIAYGSIRMEPVFMILGQSAATAATLAIDERCAVQDVNYSQLKKWLLSAGQRLTMGDP